MQEDVDPDDLDDYHDQLIDEYEQGALINDDDQDLEYIDEDTENELAKMAEAEGS